MSCSSEAAAYRSLCLLVAALLAHAVAVPAVCIGGCPQAKFTFTDINNSSFNIPLNPTGSRLGGRLVRISSPGGHGGSTLSKPHISGPRWDHTFNSTNGLFLVFVQLYCRLAAITSNSTVVTTVSTPAWNCPGSTATCDMTFFYSMSGRVVGNLSVRADDKELLLLVGDQGTGDGWKGATVQATFKPGQAIQFFFDAYCNPEPFVTGPANIGDYTSYADGDIGLDDISVKCTCAGQAISSASTSALYSQDPPTMMSALDRANAASPTGQATSPDRTPRPTIQARDSPNATSPAGSGVTGGADNRVQCVGLPSKCTVAVPLVVTPSLLVLFMFALLTVLTVRWHRSKAGSPPAVTQHRQGLVPVPVYEEIAYRQGLGVKETASAIHPSSHSLNGSDLQAGLQSSSVTVKSRHPKSSRHLPIPNLNCNAQTPENSLAIFTTAPSPTIEGSEGSYQPVLSTDQDIYQPLAETSFQNANGANEKSIYQEVTPGTLASTGYDQPTPSTTSCHISQSPSKTSTGSNVSKENPLSVYRSLTPTKPNNYQIPETEKSTHAAATCARSVPVKDTYQSVSPNREPPESYEQLSPGRLSPKPANVETRQAGHAKQQENGYLELAMVETTCSFSKAQSANSANETSTYQQLTPGTCDNTDYDQPTLNTMPSDSFTSAGDLVRNDSDLPAYLSFTTTRV